MQELYYLARHVPFWAIPLIIMGGEFAYLFWLRKKKRSAIFCLIFAFIGFVSIIFYVWAGGPSKSVKVLKKMHRDYSL